ncbi:hypothetical protein chiPu_0009590 [Chiloscyllium punctatum]|uniref:Uncharacterized protein n=1 Tax=Chiloscyllium punctatum TaxID=137246 RepID=A0A401SL69_CHIPU|nr:hypothetical protein [Chiloscyllium punctatum]
MLPYSTRLKHFCRTVATVDTPGSVWQERKHRHSELDRLNQDHVEFVQERLGHLQHLATESTIDIERFSCLQKCKDPDSGVHPSTGFRLTLCLLKSPQVLFGLLSKHWSRDLTQLRILPRFPRDDEVQIRVNEVATSMLKATLPSAPFIQAVTRVQQQLNCARLFADYNDGSSREMKATEEVKLAHTLLNLELKKQMQPKDSAIKREMAAISRGNNLAYGG